MAEARDRALNEIATLKEDFIETLDSLELTEDRKDIVSRAMKDLSKAPAPKQMLVGGTAGWLAGYTTMKLGKMAATAIGGTLLILQIAHHKGYIKMTTDSSSMAEKLKKKLHIKSKSGLEKFQDFAAKNIYVAGGFTGGFFLGIASS
ncbi:FUN14 domain-containing protein 2 isoform X1 [Eurytemora carolleeae]|uniref:FUN14 domain-containing protein 2 isoform X1 n=1 Tax=Eurytemora carolleeae TaxID=1294199 RepID=UPI000C76B52E|nr:FUN14 domain-containing protein 2 isoform X1 [Eurytemora carolleeae]|eukprot:XP_023336105.1 FUN14 domain-containing protein 2-like isoform X1 [Eurytemora affinis]